MSLTKGWKYWSVFGLAVVILSQAFAAQRSGNLAYLILMGILLAGCMLYLSFVMYAVEKKSGRVQRPIKIFEKWLSQ